MIELKRFNDLFERKPNGTWVERAVPLLSLEKRFSLLEGGNWGRLPTSIEEERRQLNRKSPFGFDPMDNYPLGQRPALI